MFVNEMSNSGQPHKVVIQEDVRTISKFDFRITFFSRRSWKIMANLRRQSVKHECVLLAIDFWEMDSVWQKS